MGPKKKKEIAHDQWEEEEDNPITTMVKVLLQEKVKELEDRIKCPVCLDMPSSGPIFTCPRGHCICKSCYQVHQMIV